jgi:hypothetical protein
VPSNMGLLGKITGHGQGPRAPVPGTAKDDEDMRRMNRRQELNVSICLVDAENKELTVGSEYTPR